MAGLRSRGDGNNDTPNTTNPTATAKNQSRLCNVIMPVHHGRFRSIHSDAGCAMRQYAHRSATKPFYGSIEGADKPGRMQGVNARR